MELGLLRRFLRGEFPLQIFQSQIPAGCTPQNGFTDSVLCSGSIEIRGNVSVGGEVHASGKVRIYCNDIDGGRLKVGGKVSGSSVHVEGHLIVE